MTISSTASEISYAGNGATVAFAIPFPFDTSADIKVTSTVTATGDVSVLSSGFAITGGAGSTGTITFTTAPASTVSITLIDDPARTQPTDYVANDAFPAESHERALDRVTRLCKRLYQRSLRSLRVPDGDPVTDAELAPVSTRKGKYLFFDAITGAIDYATAIATTTLSQGTIGALLYPRTAAEISAGVTPTNYFYPPGHVYRYGTNTTPGTTDMATALQSAITANDLVYVPPETLAIASAVTVRSNVRIYGAGKKSLLKVSTAGTYNVLDIASGDLSNFAVYDLAFDGALNYPANSQTYKQTMSNVNAAIRLKPDTMANVRIVGCYFNQLSGHSVETNTDGATDVVIRDNYFYKGGYQNSVIRCRTPSAVSDSVRLKRFKISGNTIDTCGPQAWYDPSKEDYCASADAILVDKGLGCEVSGNTIKNSSSIGIRIEQSNASIVVGNVIDEAGGDGISFYKGCVGGTCEGNTVTNWGAIPNAYGIRNYTGTYVVAKEFPKNTGPTLPADPTISSWFQTWPYITSPINTANIITYSSSDYYSGPSTGILPFRGNSAISVLQDSEGIAIHGNYIKGDTSTSGGKYTHASDFGYSKTHTVNDPAGLTAGVTGSENQVAGNSIRSCRVSEIYEPFYQDPIALAGQLGAARAITEYEQGVFTATVSPAGGSVTQSFSTLSYTKIGRLVTVTGELALSAISSPTGAVNITGLPYASAASLAGRANRAGFYVIASNLTGVTTGHVVGFLLSGTTINLSFYEAGSFSDLASKLTSTTALDISFSYVAES